MPLRRLHRMQTIGLLSLYQLWGGGLTPLIRGRRIVKRIYRRGINQYNSRLIVCILFILGFHNKLVGIPIAKKSIYCWLFFGFWILGSIITFIWMYSNNVPILILCISMIIAIYKTLKSLYSQGVVNLFEQNILYFNMI